MKRDTALRQCFTRIRSHPARWIVGALLVLVALTGCLTTYADEPSEPPRRAFSKTPVPPSPTATASEVPGVTLVPNYSVRAFETTTPTATATLTPTAELDTPTPTLEPTATESPTATSEPTVTATPTPEPTTTTAPTATSLPPSVQPTLAPFQAYAWLDNYYPAPGSVVTVYGTLLKNGRPVNGAHMGVTWSYTHGQGYCSAYTGIDGRAACAQNIGGPLPNYWVFIDVVFIHEDELYYAKTAFLTDP